MEEDTTILMMRVQRGGRAGEVIERHRTLSFKQWDRTEFCVQLSVSRLTSLSPVPQFASLYTGDGIAYLEGL